MKRLMISLSLGTYNRIENYLKKEGLWFSEFFRNAAEIYLSIISGRKVLIDKKLYEILIKKYDEK